AAQPATALAEAEAVVHLLHVVDRAPPRGLLAVVDEGRPAGLQRQPGPEIVRAPAPAQHARLALEVALLTDRLAQLRLQAARVDDVLPRPGPHVPLPRPVAALAADGVARKHRPLVAVEAVLPRRRPIGVAEHAVGRDRPPGPDALVKAGGQVPG